MKDTNRKAIIIILMSAMALWAFGAVFQTYRYTSLEEAYIFLFDSDYAMHTLLCPGGLAQYIASFMSQFFIFPAVGPLIAAIIYLAIMTSLYCSAPSPRKPWEASLAMLPCVMLMLCLENTNYKFQGHIALLLAAASIWLFISTGRRPVAAIIIYLLTYIAAGSAAIFAGICMLILSIWHKEIISPITIAISCAALPYLSYESGYSFSLQQAFTPAMYYDWGSTHYMMLYALCSLPLFTLAACSLPAVRKARHQLAHAGGISLITVAAALWIFGKIHNSANYENHQMRHYANTGQWKKIADMPYHDTPTPYTSYRFLALAKLGRLSSEISSYRPFINYLFENKPVTKKEQRQVFSDIYYQCHYIAAARHAAFDTDITTVGAFNPYETQKLAKIYIAQGHHKLAEKTISKLEKTLFHSQKATNLRVLLNDKDAQDKDPLISDMRKAIPAEDSYVSPKGMLRDLQYIICANPNQKCAQQFLEAFNILTSKH